MAQIPSVIKTWQMVQPFSKNKETGEITPGKIEMTEIPVPELKAGRSPRRSGRMWGLSYGPGIFL